jgi:hypothetical protein
MKPGKQRVLRLLDPIAIGRPWVRRQRLDHSERERRAADAAAGQAQRG